MARNITGFSLAIDTTNDSFSDDPSPEIARILRTAADHVEEVGIPYENPIIRDTNGNTVGAIRIKRENEE